MFKSTYNASKIFTYSCDNSIVIEIKYLVFEKHFRRKFAKVLNRLLNNNKGECPFLGQMSHR